MSNSRVELHKKLVEVLGSSNVYFQPPESIKMKYPCIVYTLDGINNTKADNKTYIRNRSYTITLIHSNPDNDIVDKLLNLDYVKFNNSFQTQGLNHYVFTKFYK